MITFGLRLRQFIQPCTCVTVQVRYIFQAREMSKCPICNKEATELEINNHLDNGCSSSASKAQKLFSFDSPTSKSSQNSRSNPEISPEISSKRSLTSDSGNVSMAPSKKRRLGLSSVPFAEQVRPYSLDEYVGQEDLIGPKGVLRGFLERDICPSIILWGPSGVGKTTFARILARASKSRFVELSATSHGVNDAKKIIDEARNEQKLLNRKTILFLDEIHRFNRAQQDIFLPAVEKGDIILIGATTENPSFKLNGALLSRCRVFVLKKLTHENIVTILDRSVAILSQNRKDDGLSPIEINKNTLEYLAGLSDGDARIALNILEISVAALAPVGNSAEAGAQKPLVLNDDQVKKSLKRTHMLYDRVGDSHYDTISAFHKSVRGSDVNATLFYLGRMIESGEDPLYVARRMIRIASEDVGLADDTLLPFAVSTYQAVQQIGMPEADVLLAHCAAKLAMAPKSVMIYKAYNAVKQLLHTEPGASAAPIPLHIRNAPTKLMKDLDYGREYKYNPDYKDGQVRQKYLPEGFEDCNFMPDIHLGTKRDPELE